MQHGGHSELNLTFYAQSTTRERSSVSIANKHDSAEVEPFTGSSASGAPKPPCFSLWSIALQSPHIDAMQCSSCTFILNTTKHSFGKPTRGGRSCTGLHRCLHCFVLRSTCRLDFYNLQDLSIECSQKPQQHSRSFAEFNVFALSSLQRSTQQASSKWLPPYGHLGRYWSCHFARCWHAANFGPLATPHT